MSLKPQKPRAAKDSIYSIAPVTLPAFPLPSKKAHRSFQVNQSHQMSMDKDTPMLPPVHVSPFSVDMNPISPFVVQNSGDCKSLVINDPSTHQSVYVEQMDTPLPPVGLGLYKTEPKPSKIEAVKNAYLQRFNLISYGIPIVCEILGSLVLMGVFYTNSSRISLYFAAALKGITTMFLFVRWMKTKNDLKWMQLGVYFAFLLSVVGIGLLKERSYGVRVIEFLCLTLSSSHMALVFFFLCLTL
jgi:hypothetical protein